MLLPSVMECLLTRDCEEMQGRHITVVCIQCSLHIRGNNGLASLNLLLSFNYILGDQYGDMLTVNIIYNYLKLRLFLGRA